METVLLIVGIVGCLASLITVISLVVSLRRGTSESSPDDIVAATDALTASISVLCASVAASSCSSTGC